MPVELPVPGLASPLCWFRDLLGVASADALLEQITEYRREHDSLEFARIGDLAAVVGRVTDLVCDLLGVEAPTQPRLSFELVTSDDNARPLANALARPGEESPRVTFVYWLHARPRRFRGGQLRLYDMGVGNGQPVIAAEYRDCPVEHDTVVFFPSSCWSELRPVTAPTELRPAHAPAEGSWARAAIRGWIT